MRLPLVPFALLLVACVASAQPPRPNDRAAIEALNRALDDATHHMDNAATLALWAEDGTSLLPSTKPIEGRKAIARFLDEVMASLPGARMEQFELKCFDLDISGDLASEWCTEHQIVRLAGDKPPFEGRGRMLFVLRRGHDKKWRILREMWNPSENPAPAAPSVPPS